jgi:ERCC4-type nuclease
MNPAASKPRTPPPQEPELCPFVVAVDNREQAPFRFQNFHSDADKRYRPLIVRTKKKTLRTGDYSIVGMEHLVTVERKSLVDAYGTFGADRKRFERELERMTEFQHAAVVIEASWSAIIGSPPPHSKLLPKTVYRSVIAWSQRYGVHFWDCPSRSFAERTTFRILEAQ